MRSFISPALIFGIAWRSVIASYYCASLSDENTNGVDGIFQMEMREASSASYSISFHVTSAFTSNCDLSEGLEYSINTLWKSPSDSGYGENCASTITGFHYDPNLACSSKSQSYDSKCVDAGRTPSSSSSSGTTNIDYKYSCSATDYQQGSYTSCERGDLSGKFGSLQGVYNENSDTFEFDNITGLVDYNPPYPGNLHQSGDISSAWSSVVFSCPATGETLFCAEIDLSESVCSNENRIGMKGVSVSWVDDDGFWHGEGVSLDWFDLFLLIVIFVMMVCCMYCACRFGVAYYCFGCCRKEKPNPNGVETGSRRTARESRPLLG